MEPRLSFLTLGVSDLDRSRVFYRDTLGWPLSTRSNDHVAFFQLNGFVLSLFPAAELAIDANVSSEGAGFSRFSMAYNVREAHDVDGLLARLQSQGVKIVRQASTAFWGGRTGYFADPDGFLWEVAHNPGGQLDARGNFWLEPPPGA